MENFINFIFFTWLFLLSYFLLKTRNHYNNLVSKTRKEKLEEILNVLLEKNVKISSEVDLLKKELKNQIDFSRNYFQKIGILRYDPFYKEGSKQSFVISLLDANDNGIILNFIYTREGLRIYPKKVKNGKGEEYELSDEEKKVIEISKKY
ncbi:MAG: DUF4446 family protein [Patescibacteria group bacterium]|nr:DUF4446 family protein [Patescibacteria group bacterium]